MKPTILWVMLVVAGVLACGALAAPLLIGSEKIAAGNTPVVVCDTDGFTHSYTTSRGNVTAVTIAGIADPACEGGTARSTLTNSAGASIAAGGPQTVPSDGDVLDNSVTLTTSPQPAAGQVAGIHIVVEGP